MEGEVMSRQLEPSLLKLPYKILAAIVNEVDTEDRQTLINLCIASTGNQNLLEIARAKRWELVQLDDQDLIPHPGKDGEKYLEDLRLLKCQNLGRDWKPQGQNVKVLTTMLIGGRMCPANYVRELISDFNMQRYLKTQMIDRDFSPITTALMPSVSSLKYTLDLLKAHLTSITSITCSGDLPQSIINVIGNLEDHHNIRDLKTDTFGYPGGRFTGNEGPHHTLHQWTRCAIDMKPLQALGRLESLQIGHLMQVEVSSLLTILPDLSCLKVLLVRDNYFDASVQDRGHCAIKTILENLITGAESTSNGSNRKPFPSSLHSLTLLDAHEFEIKAIPQTASIADAIVKLDSRITSLYIETDLLAHLLPFIRSFPSSQLENLSFYCMSGTGTHGTRICSPHPIISGHSDSLKNIRILAAWRLDGTFATHFNNQWAGKYSIQELVLGTENPSWSSNALREVQSGALSMILDNYLCGCGLNKNTEVREDWWGAQLRRLRIDDIRAANLDTSIPGQKSFIHLRILMLHPFICCDEPRCQYVREPAAGTLATRIAADASDNLRVIVIQKYWYWLSNSKSSVNRLEGRVWEWSRARMDVNESLDMSEHLSSHDWSFLQGINGPGHRNSRLQPTTIRNQSLFEGSFYCWNYLTALPL